MRFDQWLVVVQNFALNVAEKGFPISVYNRSYEKTEACVTRAKKEGMQGIRASTKIFATRNSPSKSGLGHLISPGDCIPQAWKQI